MRLAIARKGQTSLILKREGREGQSGESDREHVGEEKGNRDAGTEDTVGKSEEGEGEGADCLSITVNYNRQGGGGGTAGKPEGK